MAASLAWGQAVPAQPDRASSAQEEAIVLSPFEVQAEEDNGYMAATTQSGTRLRMELKDSAASISVITREMMDDLGANTLEDMLVYTLGTEVNGAMGNFSDAGVVENPGGAEADFDGAFSNAMPSVRIRGLTSADVTREFFVTSLPPDGYILDRKEISRGANAMLFGLGSPAGIVNSSLIRADLRRRKTKVGLQNDSFGSYRVALDHNEAIIKGKLAVRVASLYEDNQYKIEEAWEEDKRGFIAATWRPFRHTTIRANFEAAKVEGSAPDARPPYDAYTHWWYLGKPVYNIHTGVASLMSTPAPGFPNPIMANGNFTSNAISGQIGAAGNGNMMMYLIYNDPTSSQMNIGIPGVNAGAMRGGTITNGRLNPAGTALVAAAPLGLREMNSIYNRMIYAGTPTANYWQATHITDPAIYDFYNHMLHGEDKYEWKKWHAYNFSAEQLFLDGRAGIEFALAREKLDNGSVIPLDSTISGYTIRIDINSHFADGTPNPNFGRPFTTAYSKITVRGLDRDAGRVTGFYDMDFRKTGPEWLGNLLGRHRLQADHTRMIYTQLSSPNNFYFNNGHDYYNAVRNTVGTTQTASTATRGAVIFRYLGPNVTASATPVTGAVTTPVSQWPSGVTSVPTWFYQSPTSTAPSALGSWEVRNFSLVSASPEDPGDSRRYITYTRDKVNSSAAILQSYWLNGNIVSTVGARRDHVQTYTAGSSPPQDPVTRAAYVGPNFFPKPVQNQTVDTTSWGVVGHLPERFRRKLPLGAEISAFYNSSDNFRPAGQRYDIYNNPLPQEQGTTKDYGILLSLFEGKLRFRATKYKTAIGQSSSLPGSNLSTPLNNLADRMADWSEGILRGLNEDNPEGVAAFNAWFNGPTAMKLRETFRITMTPAAPGADPLTADVSADRRTGEVVAPSDVVSKGEEYEVHMRLTRNWDLTLNANHAVAIRSNVGTLLRQVVFEEMKPLMDGPAGTIRTNGDPANLNIARTTFLTQIYNQLLPRLSEEGMASSEGRKWHANMITNYRFTEGRLKGFGVGGAIRWMDKINIGAPIAEHPLFGYAPDVRNPHYGDAETNYDAWVSYRRKFKRFDWRIQLNVYNIGVGDELIPLRAQPDGSIAQYRIAPPQNWRLSNTFNF